jgi:outer membrane protein assembly factor BamD (BamD/ComL family)
MRYTVLTIALGLTLTLLAAPGAAQTPVAAESASAAQPDPFREADARHNLDVAQQYFRGRKAYKAVLMRFEETFAAYPEFSKMDEFLYIAGMSSLYLSENKGKQRIDETQDEKERRRWDPVKLREDAVAYLSMLVDRYPESRFRRDSEKTLRTIKQ